jgi:hypothetical protein
MDDLSEIPAIELSQELKVALIGHPHPSGSDLERRIIRLSLERYAAERVLEEHIGLCRAKPLLKNSLGPPVWGHPCGCQCGCGYVCERRKAIERVAKWKPGEKA